MNITMIEVVNYSFTGRKAHSMSESLTEYSQPLVLADYGDHTSERVRAESVLDNHCVPQ